MRPSLKSLIHVCFLSFALAFLSLPACSQSKDHHVAAKSSRSTAEKSKRGSQRLKRHKGKHHVKRHKKSGKRLSKKTKRGKKHSRNQVSKRKHHAQKRGA